MLLLSVCSVVGGDCSPTVIFPGLFDTWSDCVKMGIIETQNTMNLIDSDVINKHMLGPKFECKLTSST